MQPSDRRLIMAKIAVLVGPEFEDSELAIPVERLREEGHDVELLGMHGGRKLRGVKHRVSVTTDAAVTERRADMYAALVIPGGKAPSFLRRHDDVLDFVREFAATGRPIAAVCHGPQVLISAGLVDGVRMTAWPEVREELREAGADAVDEPVVEDRQFITSRNPDDLYLFARALLARLHEAESLAQAPGTELGPLH
jgi:protease I